MPLTVWKPLMERNTIRCLCTTASGMSQIYSTKKQKHDLCRSSCGGSNNSRCNKGRPERKMEMAGNDKISGSEFTNSLPLFLYLVFWKYPIQNRFIIKHDIAAAVVVVNTTAVKVFVVGDFENQQFADLLICISLFTIRRLQSVIGGTCLFRAVIRSETVNITADSTTPFFIYFTSFCKSAVNAALSSSLQSPGHNERKTGFRFHPAPG